MFKLKNSLAPKIINDLFDNDTEDHDNLRHRTEFRIPLVNSVYHGSESISCLGPKIWDIVPLEFKQIGSLNRFKISISAGLNKTVAFGCGFIQACITFCSRKF